MAYDRLADGRMWLTTGDAAKLLGLTREGVRFLVRDHQLACEYAASGQRLFRRGDVRRVLIQRTEDRARHRASVLQAVRVHMLKVPHEPRQLALFGRTQLRLVRSGPGSGESALDKGQVKAAKTCGTSHGSEKRSYVDRKVAGR